MVVGGMNTGDLGPEPRIETHVAEARDQMSPFDYTREQIEAVRRDVRENFDHERAYRRQYGDMAANAMVALSEQGWVTLKLAGLQEGQVETKRMLNRVFITAFSLLITMLTLLVTVIFGILRGG